MWESLAVGKKKKIRFIEHNVSQHMPADIMKECIVFHMALTVLFRCPSMIRILNIFREIVVGIFKCVYIHIQLIGRHY